MTSHFLPDEGYSRNVSCALFDIYVVIQEVVIFSKHLVSLRMFIENKYICKQKVFKKKWGRGRGVTPGFRRVRVIYAVVFFSLLFSSVLNVESL